MVAGCRDSVVILALQDRQQKWRANISSLLALVSRPAAVVVGDKVEVGGAFEAKAGMRTMQNPMRWMAGRIEGAVGVGADRTISGDWSQVAESLQ